MGLSHLKFKKFAAQLPKSQQLKLTPCLLRKANQQRLFENPEAKAIVEIRLAPGNQEKQAETALKTYLQKKLRKDYEI